MRFTVKDPTLPLDFTLRPSAPLGEENAADPPCPSPAREEPRAWTVAELDRQIRDALDGSFERPVWVEGEVTGARPASSGHVYFCLKDEREEAVIDCVIYKTNVTPRVRALLTDGARVRLRGRPTFWAPRGRLQLVADRAGSAGRGALLEALEKLKAKLADEGLFALERKRPLPREPRVIGVVTSESGAAIHDICKVAFRRGGARVLLAPAQVQGAAAANSIARALAALQRVADVDVIILGRGGGSSDDLATFNDERLVRLVAACRVPVISAVGHEVDVTLTDFVADARAATPSQAAEMVVADALARRSSLAHTRLRLVRGMQTRIAQDRARLERSSRHLGDPRLVIASFQQILDDRTSRLEGIARWKTKEAAALATRLERRLAVLHPSVRIAREKAEIADLAARLASTARRSMAMRDKRFERLAARLDAMSPLKVLARGYAIATRGDGRAVRDARDVTPGDRLALRVRRARIDVEVVAVEESAAQDGATSAPQVRS
jgi:exodeoxyribonuclease VII large subunit